jgi:thiol-disulfide isomerase/thioredoxin
MVAYLSDPILPRTANRAPSYARRLAKELPFDSPLWELAPRVLIPIACGGNKQAKDLADRVLLAMANKNVAGQTGVTLLFACQQRGDLAGAERFAKLLTESFAGTPWAMQAKMFDPNRRIMVGKAITDQSMRGKTYLIKFWATWCKPCIAEMGKLHEMYEQRRGTDFEIVMINIDDRREDFDRFRAEKWKMPWKHIILDSEQSARARETFEVWGIPRSITVGLDGIIKEELSGSSW